MMYMRISTSHFDWVSLTWLIEETPTPGGP
jgi:hypothetical protein